MANILQLTSAEARAALEAISQMTDGNGRDFSEWRLQTHGSHPRWLALLRAERKIMALLKETA